jgi:hypothetical protein
MACLLQSYRAKKVQNFRSTKPLIAPKSQKQMQKEVEVKEKVSTKHSTNEFFVGILKVCNHMNQTIFIGKKPIVSIPTKILHDFLNLTSP